MTTTEATSLLHSSFRGRVALVAGASRGIGATTARAFAQAGAAVALAARDEQVLNSVAESIRAAGGQALAVPIDSGQYAGLNLRACIVREDLWRRTSHDKG